MRRVLQISDAFVTSEHVELTCYGLGSCVGLFICDRLKGVTGGAHIPLPEPGGDGQFQHANEMIGAMLQQFNLLGCNLLTLRAKLTGGAQLLSSSRNIGKQNVEAVVRELTNRRIFIAAKDVGGNVSRTARFNSLTGELQISTSEQKTYFI